MPLVGYWWLNSGAFCLQSDWASYLSSSFAFQVQISVVTSWKWYFYVIRISTLVEQSKWVFWAGCTSLLLSLLYVVSVVFRSVLFLFSGEVWSNWHRVITLWVHSFLHSLITYEAENLTMCLWVLITVENRFWPAFLLSLSSSAPPLSPFFPPILSFPPFCPYPFFPLSFVHPFHIFFLLLFSNCYSEVQNLWNSHLTINNHSHSVVVIILKWLL